MRDLLAAFWSAITRAFEALLGRGAGDRAGAQAPDRTGTFDDAAPRRTVPFRLYAPRRTKGPAPVVIFSHGLGGSRNAAPYLGQALAQGGYVAFFLQHPGSDESVIQGAASTEELRARVMAVTANPDEALNRFRDLTRVLDQIEGMNRKGRLAGRLDLDRIGMAGHSFGARGTLVAAGQRVGLYGTRFKDRRIRAAVALSPQMPSGQMEGVAGLYDAVDIPVLHITGTEDGMPFGGGGGFDPVMRTLPFRSMEGPDKYLLVLDGATHGVFSGRSRGEIEPEDEARYTAAVTTAVVLFFDAYLKDDADALRALREDFPDTLAPGDVFEMK